MARVHPLDRMFAAAREVSDSLWPGCVQSLLLVVPQGGPPYSPPPGIASLSIPDAGNIKQTDLPIAAFRMPVCAIQVLAALFRAAAPLTAAEIEAATKTDPALIPYSLSSIEKTLAELTTAGLLDNPPHTHPRGYRFVR